DRGLRRGCAQTARRLCRRVRGPPGRGIAPRSCAGGGCAIRAPRTPDRPHELLLRLHALLPGDRRRIRLPRHQPHEPGLRANAWAVPAGGNGPHSIGLRRLLSGVLLIDEDDPATPALAGHARVVLRRDPRTCRTVFRAVVTEDGVVTAAADTVRRATVVVGPRHLPPLGATGSRDAQGREVAVAGVTRSRARPGGMRRGGCGCGQRSGSETGRRSERDHAVAEAGGASLHHEPRVTTTSRHGLVPGGRQSCTRRRGRVASRRERASGLLGMGRSGC
ncbi:MAG: hypothetical protein QOJ31_285, partial [Gaiellales bacterium]|nr:hypothetical protein [Gaiellales bacterium]